MGGAADPWLDRCTGFALRRAARQVTRIYDAHLAPAGLTLTQYSLLSTLARADERPCLRDLARWMGMDHTSLSRTLKPLEKQGLIELKAGEDSRTVAIGLTTTGRERREAARSLWEAAQEEMRRRLGEAEMAALNRRLEEDFRKLKA